MFTTRSARARARLLAIMLGGTAGACLEDQSDDDVGDTEGADVIVDILCVQDCDGLFEACEADCTDADDEECLGRCIVAYEACTHTCVVTP